MSARRHLLLDSRVGWRAPALDPSLELAGGRLALRPRPGSGRSLVDEHGSFGGLAQPTGLATDAEGRIYVLEREAHRLRRYDPCSCRFDDLSCIGAPGSGPRQLWQPRGLAISPQGDLLVADTGNRRLQIFSLKGLALRTVWGPYVIERDDGTLRLHHAAPPYAARCEPPPESAFPEGTWRPWDVVAGTCVVWVSDHENGLVHRFTPAGRWLGAIDSEENGESLHHPTHLATDAGGRLYVLQEGRDHVAIFDSGGHFVERVERPRDVAGSFRPASVAVAPDGTLFLTCCNHDACDTSVARAAEETRLYRFELAGAGLIPCGTAIPGCGQVVAFDLQGHPLALDRDRIRAFDTPLLYEDDGRFVSSALDSLIYRCAWHRVVLSGEVPLGTRVRVETFTSESAKGDDEIDALPDSRWSLASEHTLVDTAEWDCLVRSLPGRYLWLRLSLSGDGTATPGLDSIRVEYPRSSSLQFLPAVYQQDEESRDFLDRFLSLFDSIRDETGEILDSVAGYFDPLATPATARRGETDFLTWLASWMGLSLDRHWPESKRRALLAQAHRLYALRGTPEGLKLHLQLYTGIEPKILEQFRVRRWLHLGGATLGDCTELWGDDLVRRLQLDVHSRIGEFQLIDTGDPITDPWAALAHRFSVYVPLPGPASDEQRQTLLRIIELAKPAHTEAELVVVEPNMRVGLQSRVGVDSRVAAYPEGVVAGETILRQGSVLGPPVEDDARPTFRLGASSRIGTSTLID